MGLDSVIPKNDPNDPFIWLYDPTPTPTGPTPIPTLAPVYATEFPYPLQDENPNRLSGGCGSDGSITLLGRDINPAPSRTDSTGNIVSYLAVVSSDDSTIVIVDAALGEVYKLDRDDEDKDDDTTDYVVRYVDNAGLGNYIVYSVPTRDLPSKIKISLREFINIQRAGSSLIQGDYLQNGALHIAFAHLETVGSSSPNETRNIGSSIALSGYSGLPTSEPNIPGCRHLDVVVYFTFVDEMLLPDAGIHTTEIVSG